MGYNRRKFSMKNLLKLFLALFILVSISYNVSLCLAADSTGETMILATTYSVSDTGLLDGLLKDFKAKTGITVKPIVVGSGESLMLGERGECDVIIAHSKDLEEKFMENQFGKDRRPLAKNEFYIIGPDADPAKIKEAKDVFEAYAKLDGNGVFISRGDKSGTHNREMSIWKKAGIEKKPGEKYVVSGQGMAETIKIADEKNAYTMCDSATFTVMQEKIKSKKLFADPANLTNVYSVITVNPEKVKNAKYECAKKFYDYMFSKETVEMVSKYGVDKYKSPLFIILDEAKTGK